MSVSPCDWNDFCPGPQRQRQTATVDPGISNHITDTPGSQQTLDRTVEQWTPGQAAALAGSTAAYGAEGAEGVEGAPIIVRQTPWAPEGESEGATASAFAPPLPPVGRLAPGTGEPWDFIIGSDLIYTEQGARALPMVIRALATRGKTKVLYCHTKHRQVMAVPLRLASPLLICSPVPS